MAYTEHQCNVPTCTLLKKGRYIDGTGFITTSKYCEKHMRRDSRHGHPTRPLLSIHRNEQERIKATVRRKIKAGDPDVLSWLKGLEDLGRKTSKMRHRGVWRNWGNKELLQWLFGECVRRKSAEWVLCRMVIACRIVALDQRDVEFRRRFYLCAYFTALTQSGAENVKHIGIKQKCYIGKWIEHSKVALLRMAERPEDVPAREKARRKAARETKQALLEMAARLAGST